MSLICAINDGIYLRLLIPLDPMSFRAGASPTSGEFKGRVAGLVCILNLFQDEILVIPRIAIPEKAVKKSAPESG